MSNRYLVWIDEQVAQHEREIAKLMIAKEVIMKVDSSFTKLEKPRKHVKLRHQKRGATFDKIVNVLNDGALTGSEVVTAVLNKHPSTSHKSIVNALYNGKKANRLVFDEGQRKYSLLKEAAPFNSEAA